MIKADVTYMYYRRPSILQYRDKTWIFGRPKQNSLEVIINARITFDQKNLDLNPYTTFPTQQTFYKRILFFQGSLVNTVWINWTCSLFHIPLHMMGIVADLSSICELKAKVIKGAEVISIFFLCENLNTTNNYWIVQDQQSSVLL